MDGKNVRAVVHAGRVCRSTHPVTMSIPSSARIRKPDSLKPHMTPHRKH